MVSNRKKDIKTEETAPGARQVVCAWAAMFAMWFLWESALRVFLDHSQWNLRQSLSFTAINITFGVLCGLLLGTLYALAMNFFRRPLPLTRKLAGFLLPAYAAAAFALMTVPILLSYREFAIHRKFPLMFRWGSAVALMFLLYAVFFLTARRLRIRSEAVARVSRPHHIFSHILSTGALMKVLPFVGALLLLCAVSIPGENVTGRKPAGPVRYVVLITIDTLRRDYVSAYGSNNASTPVIDRLAAEGALFQDAVSTIPFTGPCHISMLTGKSPLTHGVLYNGQPLPKGVPTLAVRLRQAGFQTAAFVSGIPLKAGFCGLAPGFQVYDDHLIFSDIVAETFYGQLVQMLPYHPRGLRRQAEPVTDAALHWLSKNYTNPFFLFLHYYDPHYPYNQEAAEHLVNPWEIVAGPQDLPRQKRLYAQQAQIVDSEIARIVQFLKLTGILDETLLLVTSDHGESLGEHDYYYAHERYVYEQLLQVPLLIRCPKLIPAGTVAAPTVGLPDIYPTILYAAGLPPEEHGMNLIQSAVSKTATPERIILSHNFQHHTHGVRKGSWKLIRTDGSAARHELYNLVDDPGEKNNVFRQESRTARELQGILKQGMEKAVRSTWTPEQLSPEQLEAFRSLGYFN